MAVTGSECNHRGQSADLNWGRLVRGGTVAQLAVEIVPPGPYRTIGAQREHVVCSRRDGNDSGQTVDLNRCYLVGGGAIAQLAIIVVTPAFQVGTGNEAAAMVSARVAIRIAVKRVTRPIRDGVPYEELIAP